MVKRPFKSIINVETFKRILTQGFIIQNKITLTDVLKSWSLFAFYLNLFSLLTKIVCQLSASDLLNFLSKLQCMLGDLITCNIRCHDKYGIFTFNGVPLAICEATLKQSMNIILVNIPQQKNWMNTTALLHRCPLCVCVHTPHQRAAAW